MTWLAIRILWANRSPLALYNSSMAALRSSEIVWHCSPLLSQALEEHLSFNCRAGINLLAELVYGNPGVLFRLASSRAFFLADRFLFFFGVAPLDCFGGPSTSRSSGWRTRSSACSLLGLRLWFYMIRSFFDVTVLIVVTARITSEKKVVAK